jgi:hypothetical protein
MKAGTVATIGHGTGRGKQGGDRGCRNHTAVGHGRSTETCTKCGKVGHGIVQCFQTGDELTAKTEVMVKEAAVILAKRKISHKVNDAEVKVYSAGGVANKDDKEYVSCASAVLPRKRQKMVAALRRKKWRTFSAKMVSTGHDSTKRHCLPPLCGREAVKFRWGPVACSGRSGRGGCDLFRLYCCAFAVLNISMGVLAGQVEATMLTDDGLAARTGTPFWWWMPLPMQNCNLGCALDKKLLHALLERRVIIPCRHCVLWCPPIDEMSIINPGRRQPTCNDLWAPDPGRVLHIDLLHQFLASSNKPTIPIAGDSVQTEHTPGAM